MDSEKRNKSDRVDALNSFAKNKKSKIRKEIGYLILGFVVWGLVLFAGEFSSVVSFIISFILSVGVTVILCCLAGLSNEIKTVRNSYDKYIKIVGRLLEVSRTNAKRVRELEEVFLAFEKKQQEVNDQVVASFRAHLNLHKYLSKRVDVHYEHYKIPTEISGIDLPIKFPEDFKIEGLNDSKKVFVGGKEIYLGTGKVTISDELVSDEEFKRFEGGTTSDTETGENSEHDDEGFL